ncbi:MAG: polysaccharide pyruvyl transferase family protein [Clostridiales bacterium]|nr:polysaccharide pyruvyl transferase family protein [Clostridiales bacterium]
MKIGILTYHRSHNYGACLQAYALASWIKEETSAEAEIIDYNTKSACKFYRKEVVRGKTPYRIISNLKRYFMFKKCALEGFPISDEALVSEDISEFYSFIKDKYDIIVVGSDEVWKLGFRGFPNAYFLPDIIQCTKMGYAISARCDFSVLGKKKCELFKKYVNDFSYIGVRDHATLESVSKYTDKEVKINCDPTFNYDFHPNAERGRKIINSASKNTSGKKTIVFMFINEKIAKKIKRKLGNQYNYVSLYDAIGGITNLCTVKPFEWVDIIAGADFLITNYFHGMCFAIKSNVPFSIVEIRGGKREESKSYDLLLECGMAERFFMLEDSNLVERICSMVCRDLNVSHDFTNAVKLQQSKSRTFIDKLNSIIDEKEDRINGRQQQRKIFS